MDSAPLFSFSARSQNVRGRPCADAGGSLTEKNNKKIEEQQITTTTLVLILYFCATCHTSKIAFILTRSLFCFIAKIIHHANFVLDFCNNFYNDCKIQWCTLRS